VKALSAWKIVLNYLYICVISYILQQYLFLLTSYLFVVLFWMNLAGECASIVKAVCTVNIVLILLLLYGFSHFNNILLTDSFSFVFFYWMDLARKCVSNVKAVSTVNILLNYFYSCVASLISITSHLTICLLLLSSIQWI